MRQAPWCFKTINSMVHNHSSGDKSNDYLKHRMPGSNLKTPAGTERGVTVTLTLRPKNELSAKFLLLYFPAVL